MSDSPGEQFHVLLAPGATPPVAELARRLAPLFEVLHHDLALRLRYGGGWLARSVDAGLADAVEAVLAELEVPSHRLPADADCAQPTPVQAVRQIERRPDGVYFDAGLAVEELPMAQLGYVDLVALGEPRDLEDSRTAPAHDPLLSQARLMVEALPSPWNEQRMLFLDQREHVQPILHLVFARPRRVLRIERGTTFPASTLEGGQPWLDHFLAFVDGLLEDLHEMRVVPSTRDFWSDADLASILIGKPEELEQRLSWLEALLGLGSTHPPDTSEK